MFDQIKDYDYILETNNLTKTYGGVNVLNNVNIHVKEGDIYGFVGENGAGKTTLIRLINGLILPTSGNFSLFGIPNNDPRIYDVKKYVGAIVETVSLNKAFKALENMQYQNLITDSKLTDEQLIHLIEKCGLDYKKVENMKAGNFSLGMRQRLGIAMALVSNPKLILLDEPMNGLDPEGIIEMRETIIELAKTGMTFIISSHILSELDKVCNKIGIISHGNIIEEINISDLHNQEQKHIDLETNDVDLTLKVLKEKLKLNKVSSFNQQIQIFDDIEFNSLLKCLIENGIEIKSVQVKQESIEDYYINKIKEYN